MDISKLPKLSHTPPPHNEPHRSPEPAATPFIVRSLLEAWISLTVGLLLLLLNPTFIRYLLALARGEPFRPFIDRNLDYSATINFWSDLVVTLFAVVLMLHGVMLLLLPWLLRILHGFHFRVVLMPVLFFSALVTLANLIYLVWTYTTYGLPILSALAIIFGVMIVVSQWGIYQRLHMLRDQPAWTVQPETKSSGRGENVRSSGGG
jgi:hypothetical protein